jgi:S1-C subfamily serine protease
VANMDDFIRILQNFKIGETVSLDVQRSDMLHKVEVTIMDIS